MKPYICEVCGKEIKDFGDGLFVKIKDRNDKILRVVPVHKADCDDALCKSEMFKGFNTNDSMEISFFATEEERNEYLNEAFARTDEQLCKKYFNEDGTLKRQ